MTPRELRALLFQIDNRNLTVEELRNKLFDLTNQDNDITYDEINIINGKQQEPVSTQTTQEPIEEIKEKPAPKTIREYIISYDLNYWQDRLNKLTKISAPNIIIQSIQEEINNLESDKLTLKTGKKLSESPAINPVIKKVSGDYVLIEFDNDKAIHGKIEFCRKSGNRYVRNK